MNLFSRHKNTVALATLLLAQLLALAVQVKKQTSGGPVRIIRLLTVDTVGSFERAMMHSGQAVRGVWTNYVDLRGVRRENLRLKAETDQLLLQRARQQEELRQAHRIEALLDFKQKWIDTTVAAQVIGTSGMENSRLLYLDKGAADGIRPDMPVITPDGVVGKVLAVFGNTSQVLMINDLSSGVGAILTQSRLQGIVKGTPTGGVRLQFIMSDQSVKPGEALVTSGGDEIFPKGLPIGTVARVSPGRDMFLDIAVRPAVDLDRLEEVLIITRQAARASDASGSEPVRAADILAEHLPSVPASYFDAAASPHDAAAAAKKTGKAEKPEATKTNQAAAPAGAAAKTPAPARRKAASPGERQPTPESAGGEGTHGR